MATASAGALFVTALAACAAPPAELCGGGWTYVEDDPFTVPQCDPEELRACCASGIDTPGCTVVQLVDGSGDAATLGKLAGMPEANLRQALRRLVPVLDFVVLDDADVPVPVELPYPCTGTIALPVPIDWDADPCDGGRTSRQRFQTLGWVGWLLDQGDDTLGAASFVLVDWADRVLPRQPALDHTWGDHAMAERLTAVTRFLQRYVRSGPVLNRRVVHAALLIMLTHIYALATESCYAPRHNHGVMQDIALLRAVGFLDGLADAGKLARMAETRLIREQVLLSVTDDGIHTENSPHYHLLYADLLTAALADFYAVEGRTPPAALVEARDALVSALVYQLQPNLTLPQLGDTINDYRGRDLVVLLDQTRASIPMPVAVQSELEFVLSRARAGATPEVLDRVFTVGGYAAFRDRWDSPDSEQAITAHFSSKRITSAHSQRDETGFEIYGFGQELIVDAGRHGTDKSEPLTAYQYTAAAHNVLRIDGNEWDDFEERAHLVDHAVGAELSWVRGTHDYHRHGGVSGFVRTFAHAKPDVFVVIDSLQSSQAHQYEQHFHLHPTLTEITSPRPGTLVARATGGGPAVALVAGYPADDILTRRGDPGDGGPPSWYFQRERIVEPSTDMILRSAIAPGTVVLPAYIVLLPPESAAEVPVFSTEVLLDRLVVSWTDSRGEHRVEVPAGPL